MSRETTDTNSQFNDAIPDGTYDFEVHKVVRKEIKGKVGYEWSLDYGDQNGKQLFWPNQMGDLLRLLGCKETAPGKFDWETDLMEGQTFKATVSRKEDKKSGKTFQMMGDFKKSKVEESAPF